MSLKSSKALSLTTRLEPGDFGRELTPRRIVDELDRYIVSQDDAKRAIAVALRNRWRRLQLSEDQRREILPKNILMIGSTGVGKTEIARRVARMVDAPFLKVEATKFTEVGYVGRDVDSIVRDLLDVSITMLHRERLEEVQDEADNAANQRIADMLIEQQHHGAARAVRQPQTGQTSEGDEQALAEDRRKHEAAIKRRLTRQRKKFLDQLTNRQLEDETVELELESEIYTFVPPVDIGQNGGTEEMPSVNEFLDGLMPRRNSRRVSVREARKILAQQEAHRLVDFDAVIDAAIKLTENSGIVFIDELDKTITPQDDYGPDVSGEGVQRDLLPIVEGSVVSTRYGTVKTDHILFVAAGSFHNVRPADLIPELQGRFPIRVELSSLTEEDLYRILTEPENSLVLQYQQLLATEQVTLEFDDESLHEIAKLAYLVNQRVEDIGARRLHTMVERVLEDISFDAPEKNGERVQISAEFVRERIGEVADDDDLSNFIL